MNTRMLPWRAAILTVAAISAMAAPLGIADGPAAASAQAEHRPPDGRVWASWAYDPARHDAVLFGGDTSYQSGPDIVFGKTWTWNGARWARRHPAASPSPRTGAAMVYDPAAHQLLLFGGSLRPFSGGGYLADTWAWTGTTWTRLRPAASPPARHNADLVYDRAQHAVILFGGYDGRYLNDTWAWNGTTWTQLHPAASPPPRDTHSLVYDPATKAALLFGGYNDDGRLSDTWSWDGTTWTQLHPATSPGTVSPAWQAAWDGASGQLILFGGDESGPFSNSTWTWTGTTWRQLHPAVSPAQRSYGSLTYDRALHRLVLFAGSTGTTDPSTIWEWNGTTWRRH